ncbi:MAG TPA: xanthine permease [Epulopiscium sp.]|nr:xanthine permease [Candidatus Epulonipiscium sp.]
MKKTGREDVTALPSGPSAPSIFIIVFMVIMPIAKSTGDIYYAWQVALGWCFLEALIELSGAFIGDWLRRIIPRTVLLSALAGLGLLLLAMNPILQSFESPYVSLVVIAVIFINWFGKKPIFRRIPTGFLILALGTLLAWVFGQMNVAGITDGLANIGFSFPTLQLGDLFKGISPAFVFLISAIPLGVTNFIFTHENIESAAAAGDEYNVRNIMLANGISSIVGYFFGNPFPTTVYIGHPGWKSIGAGVGYTLVTGFSVFLITLFGLGGLFLGVIPLSAVFPILFYVGIVVAKQAVTESPAIEIPAVFVSLFPWIANWALTLLNNTLSAAGTNAAEVGLEAFQSAGVYHRGLVALGSGAPISSIIWGCLVVFSIRSDSPKAIITALVGAALTYTGVIHSVAVGWAQQPSITVGYLLIVATFVYKYFADKHASEDEIKAPEQTA